MSLLIECFTALHFQAFSNLHLPWIMVVGSNPTVMYPMLCITLLLDGNLLFRLNGILYCIKLHVFQSLGKNVFILPYFWKPFDSV